MSGPVASEEEGDTDTDVFEIDWHLMNRTGDDKPMCSWQ